MSNLAIIDRIEAELDRRQRENRLRYYQPYAPVARWHALPEQERALIAANQVGKFHPVSEPVLTPSGWRQIGELSVGDEVIAGDGSITRVAGVFPQGVQPYYKLTFDGGEVSFAGGEHLWQVILPAHRFPYRHSHGKMEPNPSYGRQSVVTTDELRERFYRTPGVAPIPRQRAIMPHCGAVQFKARGVPVDPYVLGVLLGDGCLRQGVIGLTSADQEIVDAVAAAVPFDIELKQASAYGWRVVSRKTANGGSLGNSIKASLVNLGVYGKLAHEKFVPHSYLHNSPDVRLAVLQGLMDTDGSVAKNGAIEYCSTSRSLADDVVFLVRSFGGKASIVLRQTEYTHKGIRSIGRVSYRVRVRLPQVTPFRLGRKVARLIRPVSTCDEHVLHTIEPAGSDECVCIKVEHPSRLYVTRDFIVTHNTFGAGSEVAMHLTGLYPEWWTGKRFDKPPVGWVAGVTGEATRDNPQRILLGRPGEWGTGTLPKDSLSHVQRAPHRVADAVDYILVKHATGHLSRVYFKAYDQGREKFQGETLDFGWCDEEPPEDVYIEFLTRLNVTQGPMLLTFTPLLGMSSVVKRFIQEKRPGTAFVSMTIEDAEHYTPEQRKAIIDRYPAHEREARTKGIPSLGSGRIFPVTEEMLAYDPFEFPSHWPRVAGMDFGGVDHPAAAAFCAIDPEADCLYVYDAWRAKALFLEQAGAIRTRCHDWIPVAWPHDGLQQDRHSGVQLAEQFRDQGLPMMPERATFEDGTNGVEAGISMMLTMMQTGRLKVAKHLRDVFEEIALYHRRDGKVVKEGDDLISALRYAVMMRRYADTPPRARTDSGVIQTWMG